MYRRFVLVMVVVDAWFGSHATAQDLSVVPAYKTVQAPVLDGVIGPGEWDAAGPWIVVAPEEGGTTFPADPFGGPSDASYQFRAMWEEPWTLYFAFEVTDDIAMNVQPTNVWEQDQVEFFMDGDDLEGSDVLERFQWWDSDEIYGKFGASRWLGIYEGNTGAMSEFIEDLYADGFGAFAIAVANETGKNADYVIEYAVSLEPMWDHGTFDGTPTGDAEQIVQDSTVVKWTVALSDDDNFGDGTTGRSNTITYFRDPDGADWRDTTAFADLTFLGPYNPGAGPELKAGDANQDLKFDQLDLVQVQIAAKYLTGQAATWGEGDWNAAPGGSVGSPPAGDGQFNQLDIIAALNAGTYLTGPYAAVAPNGTSGDEQTSVIYNTSTGELAVDAPASTKLTSINIDSAAGIFTGDPAQNLGGSFDNDADGNIFKATFGSSFGSLSFGNVAQPGLSAQLVASDLSVVGSLAGGGDLGNVDLIYVPEPSTLALLTLSLLGVVGIARRRSR